jgi:hypothetical protein
MTNSFYTDTIQKSPHYHSYDCIRDLDLLEPVTRKAVQNIINDAKLFYKIELMVTETYRSEQRQLMLFQQRKTQLKQVGCHHFGVAADFAKVINGKPSWLGDWSFLCTLAKRHGMICGGDWGEPGKSHTFLDRDHVQRISVSHQQKLFSKQWYPGPDYNPYQMELDV